MKPKHIVLTLLFLSMSYTAEAQFFKKLKKKVQKAAERTILKKTDEEVTKKTNQTIDGVLNPKEKEDKNATNNSQESDSLFTESAKKNKETAKKSGGLLGMLLGGEGMDQGNAAGSNPMKMMGDPIPAPPDNNVQLPNSYNFSYVATIEVKSNNGSAKVEYLLQPNETYYAKKQTKNGFTEHIVYDNERSTEIYYADIQGEKRRARRKMNIFTKARLIGAFKDAPDKKVKLLGNKKLLDYNCEGYEISNQDGTTQLWVTNEAPATMYAAMFENRAKMPNSPFTKNTMIMEVNFTSNKSADKNYQMICKQLQPKTMAFNLTDYKE